MILVATDFSNASNRAAELAGRLAHLRGCGVCLLHIFDPPVAGLPDLAIDQRWEEEMRRAAASQLFSAASLLRKGGILVEERLERGGPPALVIADVANRVNPDLVVLGRHGRRTVPRLLLGSVAESALMHIHRPVLVVPEAPAETPTISPEHRWHVAVGIDSSDSNRAVIEWVRDLRAKVPCDVTFIHLYWPVSEYERFGLPGPRDPFEPDRTTIELLQISLAKLVGTLPGKGKITFRVVPNFGPPGERLAEEAALVGADFLALGTHHRRGLARLWHGSTATPALHAATLPVLCVSKADRPASPPPISRYRNVLVATDLSELGNRAVPHAYALARAVRGTVHLLHVHERPLPSPAYAYASPSEGTLAPQERQDLRAQLLALVPSEAAEMGIMTDPAIVDGGRAAEVICQTAERLDADVIVLGSHGRAGIGRALLGSVAARVLHQSQRPVFVVRQPVE